MDKILERFDDQLNRGTIVYAKSEGDSYVYEDKECTKKIDAETLLRLFLSGIVLNYPGTMSYLKPNLCGYSNELGCTMITFFGASESTARYSKEYNSSGQ